MNVKGYFRNLGMLLDKKHAGNHTKIDLKLLKKFKIRGAEQEFWDACEALQNGTPVINPLLLGVQSINEYAVLQSHDSEINILTYNHIFKLIKHLNPQSIIDIGCGEGRLTRELHLKFKNSVVHGVDYSIKSINMAKALNSDMNIDFFAKNIIEDSLKRTYDVATLMEVYEHIPPEISNDFLSGIHKLLNNEGILHLTVPHKNVLVSAHHFRHFSVKSLVTELEPYFDIIEVMPFERISIKRKWLMKLFINKFFILNHKTLTTKLYNYYKSSLFYVQKEDQCQRIYIQCKKK